MKVKYLLSLFLLFAIALGGRAAEPLQYEIVGSKGGTQGTYIVKVYVMEKKSKPDLELLKKCAVHGVLFKGFTIENSRVTQKPLAGSPLAEQEHADFFEAFFRDGGAYNSYVSMITPQYDIVKMSKKQYRIGATFSVAKDQLRKDLEQAGILKGLNSGF